ncbi:hypothetical protein LTR66_005063 [Elasticomyces elasticus]|nr:hypothetical protein LTR66_005063 [Elasticomyces elasticus]
MTNDTPMTDDYVAELLIKDAKASTLRYAGGGTSAYPQKRPEISAPKPNTRFLSKILRATGTHNKALLAKEAEESRARLDELRGKERKARESKRPEQRKYSVREKRTELVENAARMRSAKDQEDRTVARSHHNKGGDIRSTKRKHNDGQSESENDRKRRRRSDQSLDNHAERHHRQHKDHKARSIHGEEEAVRSRLRRRHKHRSTSVDSGEEKHRSHKRSERRYTRVGSPSTSPDSRKRCHETQRAWQSQASRAYPNLSRRHEHLPITSKSLNPPSRRMTSPASSSDPLDSIIGPSPPPKIKSRGRGAQTSHAMDSRFNPAYDPSTDIALDVDEEDDWDQALEALKDRQRWKAQGAERLRAAGFTDGEVTNWEKGFLGGKKGLGDVDGDITSVKWAKKGEGREWDRGKVVDEEGDVKLRAEWGRLKGT